MKDQSISYRVFIRVNYLILTLAGLATVYPYLNVLAIALNDASDSAKGGIYLWPRVPTWDNFKLVLGSDAIVTAAINSVGRVLIGTTLALMTQFAAAYAFTRKDLPGRTQLLIFLTIPMFFSGGLIPQYILYSKIHFINSFLVYVIPGVFSFFNMIVIRTYMNTIPPSLEESAKIDGASEITIFYRIMLPLSKPILATIALWVAVSQWNDWTTTLYFILNQKYYTLQYILVQMIKEGERVAAIIQEAQLQGLDTSAIKIHASPEALKAAQVIITTLPIIAVYPFLQKYFIKGVMIGSVKE
ncbi:carbohydrate ABC transporter permease [Paenibacillus koleovorans]|uniref:carbohydrate ABC transporter permease n=1 Tax=Paenibacillus koleovorans TaxID=121608 RepID=UPI000FD7031B|nr:carbohydrate ABC transporter permease [Paenibacillus koleovorans]